MKTYWHNCCAYWFDYYTPEHDWLGLYNWTWAEENDMSQFLGTPFGLNLKMEDMDSFFTNKISKKLDYWSTMKHSLASMSMIVNQVFFSTIWFLIIVWRVHVKYSRKYGTILGTTCGQERRQEHALE